MLMPWLLLISYALIGAANVIRAVQAWVFSPILTETSLPLPFLGGLYLILGLLFIIVGILYVRSPNGWARGWVWGLALGYQIIVWLIHFLGDRAAYARRLWGRDLILSLVFLAWVFLITKISVRLRR